MQGGFARALWESFKSALNAVITVVALVVSMAVWFFAPNAQVSLGLIVPIGTIVAVLLLTAALTLFDTALASYDRANAAEEARNRVEAEYENYKARSGIPRVVQGRRPFTGMSAELICFLESSDLFSHGIMVSFFNMNEQGFEEFIGIGVVINVQEDGKIQAAMTRAFPGHEDFNNRLKQNEGEAVRTTRVKPNVPQEIPDF